MSTYSHTQYGIIHWFCLVPAAIFAGLAWQFFPIPVLRWTFIASGGVCAVLGLCMQSLTVTDCGDQLQVAFGPLPLIRKVISYSDVADAGVATTSWIDGWGVHYVPGRGWTYNIHGWDCVQLRLCSNSTVRIGTDDAEKLAEVIRERLH